MTSLMWHNFRFLGFSFWLNKNSWVSNFIAQCVFRRKMTLTDFIAGFFIFYFFYFVGWLGGNSSYIEGDWIVHSMYTIESNPSAPMVIRGGREEEEEEGTHYPPRPPPLPLLSSSVPLPASAPLSLDCNCAPSGVWGPPTGLFGEGKNNLIS